MIVSALVGIGGLLVGVKGQRLAKQADGRAQAALVAAEESNGIARAANEISKEANAIARVAAGEQGEDWHVNFDVEWHGEQGGLIVRNGGRDTAHKLSVIVAGQKLHKTDVVEQLDAGQVVLVPVPKVAEMRLESIRAQEATFNAFLREGVLGNPPHFEIDVVVDIVCCSPLGLVRRQQERLRIT